MTVGSRRHRGWTRTVETPSQRAAEAPGNGAQGHSARMQATLVWRKPFSLGGPIRASRAAKTQSCGTRTRVLHSHSAPGACSVGDPGPLLRADILPPHLGRAWSCCLAHTPAHGSPRSVFPSLAGLGWGLLAGDSSRPLCHLVQHPPVQLPALSSAPFPHVDDGEIRLTVP